MNDASRLEPLPEDWQCAMAVVAHPDDLEYGSASAIARWTAQGKEVVYVLVSSGEAGIDSIRPEEAGPLREEEERRSAAAVGVPHVEFLGYPDGVIEYGLPLRRDITRAIRRHRPEIIVSINQRNTLAPQTPNMEDHVAVGHAILVAARDAGNRWVFPELQEEGLEPWNGVRLVCFNGSPCPTNAVDVTGFLDRGVASLNEHAVYIRELGTEFDADSFLRSGAEQIGKRLGCELAVSFEVFRLR